MQHAASRVCRHTAQYVVIRLAVVNDGWQPKPLGELQVPVERLTLAFRRRVVAVVVEASFADADDLWRARQLGDSAEVSIRSLGGQVGVDADRRAGPADLARLEDRGAAAREVIPDE